MTTKLKNAMKKLILLSPLFVLFLFSACEKKETEENNTTGIEFTVRNADGEPVFGTAVELYTSLNDLLYSPANKVQTRKIADDKGKVRFEGLSASTVYYWYAKKDCEDNVSTETHTGSTLTEGVMTNIDIDIVPVGIVELTNNTNSDYDVTVTYENTEETYFLASGAEIEITHLPVGMYAFKMVQTSNYGTGVPNENISEGNLGCGETLIVEIN